MNIYLNMIKNWSSRVKRNSTLSRRTSTDETDSQDPTTARFLRHSLIFQHLHAGACTFDSQTRRFRSVTTSALLQLQLPIPAQNFRRPESYSANGVVSEEREAWRKRERSHQMMNWRLKRVSMGAEFVSLFFIFYFYKSALKKWLHIFGRQSNAKWRRTCRAFVIGYWRRRFIGWIYYLDYLNSGD